MSPDRRNSTINPDVSSPPRSGLGSVERYHEFADTLGPTYAWARTLGTEDVWDPSLEENIKTVMKIVGIPKFDPLEFLYLAEESVVGGRQPSAAERIMYQDFSERVDWHRINGENPRPRHPAFALTQQVTD